MTPEQGEGIRFESWDEVLARPAFEVDIDPRAVELKHIVGTYNLPDRHPCGLSTCHQPHGLGYVVATDDSRETNIGATCGAKHFTVSFKLMRKAFDQARQYRDQVARLAALQAELPVYRAEVELLKAGPAGATRIQSLLMQLSGQRPGSVPDKVSEAVRKAVRRGDGGLYIPRKATASERGADNVIIDRTGRERRAPTIEYVDERVGQLEGFSALASTNEIRPILIVRIEPLLMDLERVDLERAPAKAISKLHKRSESLVSDLGRLRFVLSNACRLLQRSNLEQLAQFADTHNARRTFAKFLEQLPAGEVSSLP